MFLWEIKFEGEFTIIPSITTNKNELGFFYLLYLRNDPICVPAVSVLPSMFSRASK